MLLLLSHYGLSAVHVPYKGGGAIITDLAGGRIQMTLQGPATVISGIRAGRLKPVAIASLRRSALLPDVPTFNESGVPGFEVSAWQALMAPANTPATIVRKLSEEMLSALDLPDTQAKVAALGAELTPSTPQQYAVFLKKELDTWTKVVETNGLKRE
jgi:tripartite-type tricarboxylate transporter receptor subunit TctC